MPMARVQRRAPFGVSIGLRQIALHDKSVPVLDQRHRRENGPPDRFLTLLHP